jgi:hypothetical protein
LLNSDLCFPLQRGQVCNGCGSDIGKEICEILFSTSGVANRIGAKDAAAPGGKINNLSEKNLILCAQSFKLLNQIKGNSAKYCVCVFLSS